MSKEQWLINNEMKIRRYTPKTEEQCRNIAISFIKLQNNWNELKKWLEEKMSVYEQQEASNFYVVLNKMQELENNNES